jgi:hypothetical protein
MPRLVLLSLFTLAEAVGTDVNILALVARTLEPNGVGNIIVA